MSSLRPVHLVFVAVLGTPAAHAAHGGVFVAESDESIVLSDRTWLPSARLLVAHESAASPALALASANHRPFDTLVARAAQHHGLQPALIHAVISVESGYSSRAVSRRGAMGLMQLMPPTARALGVSQPFDPAQNILGGAQHLRQLLDEFGGDTRLALAAYNAGAAAVYRHGRKVPPYPETQAYVPRVLAQMARLVASTPAAVPLP